MFERCILQWGLEVSLVSENLLYRSDEAYELVAIENLISWEMRKRAWHGIQRLISFPYNYTGPKNVHVNLQGTMVQ